MIPLSDSLSRDGFKTPSFQGILYVKGQATSYLRPDILFLALKYGTGTWRGYE